jgi:hypothetical protein
MATKNVAKRVLEILPMNIVIKNSLDRCNGEVLDYICMGNGKKLSKKFLKNISTNTFYMGTDKNVDFSFFNSRLKKILDNPNASTTLISSINNIPSFDLRFDYTRALLFYHKNCPDSIHIDGSLDKSSVIQERLVDSLYFIKERGKEDIIPLLVKNLLKSKHKKVVCKLLKTEFVPIEDLRTIFYSTEDPVIRMSIASNPNLRDNDLRDMVKSEMKNDRLIVLNSILKNDNISSNLLNDVARKTDKIEVMVICVTRHNFMDGWVHDGSSRDDLISMFTSIIEEVREDIFTKNNMESITIEELKQSIQKISVEKMIMEAIVRIKNPEIFDKTSKYNKDFIDKWKSTIKVMVKAVYDRDKYERIEKELKKRG